MNTGRGGMGSHKHGTSGHSNSSSHFTGRRAGKKIRRKGSTKKQRKLNRGSHVNKYSK